MPQTRVKAALPLVMPAASAAHACRMSLRRYCPADELVKGIGGNPDKGINGPAGMDDKQVVGGQSCPDFK
jgi:hypothetical protein